MTSCWKTDPDSRPSFSELIPILDRQVDEGWVSWINLDYIKAVYAKMYMN